MNENILKEINEKKKNLDELNKKLRLNEEILEKLKKYKKVKCAINLLKDSHMINSKILEINNSINNLINSTCNHDLVLYKDYNIDMYDSIYEYYCIECGKLIESSHRLNNVIYSDNAFIDIKNDYFNYLYKYGYRLTIEIMLNKYNNSNKNIFNELLNNGIDEIRALKLIKNRKDN